MRTRVLPALAVGVLLLSDGASLDRALGQSMQPQPQPELAGVFQAIEVPATVESVYPQARQVLLRLADDTFVTLRVGPQVRNLAQLKPGERVSARYTEALAVRLARPEGSAGTPSSQPDETATGASAARLGRLSAARSSSGEPCRGSTGRATRSLSPAPTMSPAPWRHATPAWWSSCARSAWATPSM